MTIKKEESLVATQNPEGFKKREEGAFSAVMFSVDKSIFLTFTCSLSNGSGI